MKETNLDAACYAPTNVENTKVNAFSSSTGHLYITVTLTVVNYRHNFAQHIHVTAVSLSVNENIITLSDYVIVGLSRSYLHYQSHYNSILDVHVNVSIVAAMFVPCTPL